MPAHADSISYEEAIPMLTTNWSRTANLPKFDPGLGSLTKILLEITAQTQRSYAFENLDAAPAIVKTKLNGSIILQKPDFSNLIADFPEISTTDAMDAFDTSLDFMGTSGKAYPVSIQNGNGSQTLIAPFSPADQATYVGTMGFVSFPVRAVATAVGSGPGNLYLLFSSKASATVKITYEYVPIPEPATAMLMAASIVCCGTRRRRRLR